MPNYRSLIAAAAAFAAATGCGAQPAEQAADTGCDTAASILEQNSGSTYVSTLAALGAQNPEAAGLAGALFAEGGNEDFTTLFVPTDSALEAAADPLSNEDILQVLLTHAAAGNYLNWNDGQQITALSGESLTLGTDPKSVMLTGAPGSMARITTTEESCAGPVHIISQVLLADGSSSRSLNATAPAPAPEEFALVPGLGPAMGPAYDAVAPLGACENIVDALLEQQATFPLGLILQEVAPEELVANLTDPDANVTVLAPPRAAQLKLLGGLQEGLLNETEVLSILALHIIPEYLPSTELVNMDGNMVPTYSPDDATLMLAVDEMPPPSEDVPVLISFTSGNTTVNVTYPDVEGCDPMAEVIHLIDGVLLPEGTSYDLAALPRGDLASLVEAPAPAPGEALTGGSRDLDLAPGEAPGEAGSDAAGTCVAISAIAGAAALLALAQL